jgi:phosphoribosyl 1,2-cyclic phosphate phosphodiesterase
MAEAIVLGSGTSNGVPMLGHRYPAGFLDNPKNHRTRSSLALLGPSGNVLVDCSPEMRLQLTRETIYDIEAVIITHTHADHVMGMDDLRSLCMVAGRAMPIYTLPEYGEDIRRIFPYAFVDAPPGLFYPRFELHAMPESMTVAGLEIERVMVEHGPTPVIGLRCGNLAYITDVSHVPAESEARLHGLDVLILDALRYRLHPNHFNVEQALAFVARVQPRQTYFTHLTHDFDHDVANAQFPPDIELAYDGLRVPFES